MQVTRVKTISYRDLIEYNSGRQIHNLFKYPAKLIPEIPMAYLNDQYIQKNGVVLDPFCGAGTVMVEAQRLGYKSKGIDINPLCYLISKVKTTPVDFEAIKKKNDLFSSEINSFDSIDVNFKNREYWFNETITNALGKILNWINNITDSDTKDFFRFVFASIIRKASNADTEVFPPVLSSKRKDTLDSKTIEWVNSLFSNQVDYAAKILNNHFSKISTISDVECILGSATEKQLKNKTIDLIITSPPYINAQKYIRTTKFELFWLGEINNETIVDLDKKVVGTERVFKHEFNENDIIDTFWEKDAKRLLKVDKWRAQIVHEYFENMTKVIELCYSYLKDNCYFILVIGNNTIRGKKVKNNDILQQIAEEIGFTYDASKSVKDKIKKRSLPELRNKTADVMDFEYIQIFKKN